MTIDRKKSFSKIKKLNEFNLNENLIPFLDDNSGKKFVGQSKKKIVFKLVSKKKIILIQVLHLKTCKFCF